MIKRWATPNICAIRYGCDFVQYESKIETIMRIHSWNLLSANNFESV
jgi:hypothetical protein